MENAHTPEEKAAAVQASEHPPLPAETPVWDILPITETASVPEEIAQSTPPLSAAASSPAIPPSAVSSPVSPRSIPSSANNGSGPTVREQLKALLVLEPDITAGEAARRLGKDRSNVNKIMKELRDTPSP